MTVTKAICFVVSQYEKAKKQEYIRNPLAYALYKAWKVADSEGTEHGYHKCKDCKHDDGKCAGKPRQGPHKGCFEPKIETVTNDEHFRAQISTEDALAVFLMDAHDGKVYIPFCQNRGRCFDSLGELDQAQCHKCMVAWLRANYEGEAS